MAGSESEIAQQTWDERYRSHPHVWSGEPNPVLLAEVSGRSPGSALDAGCGEGADACWLAARGWEITGADISAVALKRAAAEAKRLHLDISWLHLDLVGEPAPGTYDLVSAHYLHLPVAARRTFFVHLAAAVAPSGTLLVVGHDASDAQTTARRPDLSEVGWGAGEVADGLGDGWTVEIAEARPRAATDPDGREITVHDAVTRARRT